jgi:hypothetical protein
MLKFQIGADESCAGCVLALPTSVWDSWQRHLGRPDLEEGADGLFHLRYSGSDPTTRISAWIYLFDVAATGQDSPSPIVLRRGIATDADAMEHYALKVAPAAAVTGAGAADRVLASIRRRIGAWWPELAQGPVVLPPTSS